METAADLFLCRETIIKEESDSEQMPFVCGFCYRRFDRISSYCHHITEHNESIDNWFHICDNFKKEKNITYSCKKCLEQFPSVCLLHSHLLLCMGSYIFDHEQNMAFPIEDINDYVIRGRSDETEEISNSMHGQQTEKTIKDNFGDNKSCAKGLRSSSSIQEEENVKLTAVCTQTDITLNEMFNSVEHQEVMEKGKRGRGRSKASSKNMKGKDLRRTRAKKFASESEENDKTNDCVSLTLTLSDGDSSDAEVSTLDFDDCSADKKAVSLLQAVLKASNEICIKNGGDSRVKVIKQSVKAAKATKRNIKDANEAENVKVRKSKRLNERKKRKENPVSDKDHIGRGWKMVKLNNVGRQQTHTKPEIPARIKPEYELKIEPLDPVNEKQKKEFRCDVCGKVCVDSGKLKHHMISHSDARKFVCEICSVSYKYPNHLKVHMRSHSAVKPFCCELCGEGFIELQR